MISRYNNSCSILYKFIVGAFVSAMVVSPAYAQQRKADTVAVRNAATSKPLLADNLPAPALPADKKAGYSKVPLAGEKSYFGEKNEFVNDFVRKYLELHYNSLGTVQNRSETPFSIIDDELQRKNMPKELKYLAVIESALNHNAVSRAGAVGPWQLMETTARMMGLSVTRRRDERRDMLKSTMAATKYLELLYSQLNDWLLVIAAYNSGPTPVLRAIDRTGSRNFWDIKQYLPRETQGHVLAFIATASIFENLSKFISLGSIPVDFKFGKEEEPATVPAAVSKDPNAKPGVPVVVKKAPYSDEELQNMTIVRITEPLFLELVAQEIGADKKLLARWNADYDTYVYGTYPTAFYNLRLPKDKQAIFLQKKEQLTKKSKAYFSANR